jgi:hypothetical protein
MIDCSKMNLDSFLVCTRYDFGCPDHIPPERWKGMLQWLRSRAIFQDGLTMPPKPQDERKSSF